MVNLLRLQVFVALVGLGAITVALAYFLLVVKPVNEPAPGGTYVEGVVVDSSADVIINPLYAPDLNSFSQDVGSLVFSGLTRSARAADGAAPGQVIQPDLADSWTSSADGREWEFRLRRDARWQDGQPVTVRDVLFTLGLVKDPEYNGSRELANRWKQVEVNRLGDYTVRFRLAQPSPFFLSYTTLGLLPAHKLEGKVKAADLPRAEFNRIPVGSGPFQLAPGGLADDGVTLIANPLYYGSGTTQRPFLDKIWFRFYPSASAAVSALQANQIDGVSEVTSAEIKRLEGTKNITQLNLPRTRNTFLFLNLQRTSLFEKPVRQALAYAINRPGLIDKALNGQGQVSRSPVLDSSWAYKEDLKSYGYDPEKARRLLDEAGWKPNRDGIRERNGQPLVFRVLVEDSPDKRAVADYLAENFRAVQVAVRIQAEPSLAALNVAITANNYDALLLAVEGIPNDPDQYTNWHSSYAEAGANHLNFANWKMDRADRLLEEARSTVKQEDRRRKYLEWQEIWAEDLPSLPLYYSVYSYVVSNRVQGVESQKLKVLNVASDRLKDVPSRYIFFRTRFGS